MRTIYRMIAPFVTKDGSEIRELMHPAVHGNRNQSFAEATVQPGTRTALHRHDISEEIYHITQGQGTMTLGDQSFPVSAGDTVCIAPGVSHRIEAGGSVVLRILCACSPPYSHRDTELL
jgi:mannose-6-phosphate isomerase-like protein (cupin superfamily)